MGMRRNSELQDDLESLRQDLTGLASHLTQALGETGSDMSDEMRKRIQKLGGDIDRVMSDASSKGQEVARKMSPDNIGGTIESSIREYPLVSLAIAVGVGALVGSQLRR